MRERIWLSLAHMGGREQEFIREAFETNWVVPLGPNVDAFEKALEDYLTGDTGEERHVVALSSGTAALHLGLLLLDVGRGDEVVCQSFTFSASANPIVYQGATPVFVDSEEGTWDMDPVLLEEAIKDRLRKTGRLPKAIVPVWLYGMPGRIGEAGLSFNGNKVITTSGGGALVCRTAAMAKRVMFYATQARESAPHYQHERIGYNYRMSNICAGIGRGQMFVLDEHVRRRRENHARYAELLSGLPGVEVKSQPGGGDYASNYWLTCVTVEPGEAGFTREDLRLALDGENIESRPLWKPMHLQPVFKDAPFYGNGTSERLFEKGLCLPSGPTLREEDLERVAEVVKKLAGR